MDVLPDERLWPVLAIALVFATFAFIVFLAARRERDRPARVGERLRRLGFARTETQLPGALNHWVGTHGGRPALIGYYPGSLRAVGTSGLVLMLQVGTLPGQLWGADLSRDPPELTGSGEGRERLLSSLTPEMVEAARGLTFPMVLPGEGLLEGQILHGVVHSAWPGGWRGLHVRAVLPTKADDDAIEEAFARMEMIAAAFHSDV